MLTVLYFTLGYVVTVVIVMTVMTALIVIAPALILTETVMMIAPVGNDGSDCTGCDGGH